MWTNDCRNGHLRDVEVKITMKVFIEGDEHEKSYEEKKEYVEDLMKYITRDKDITKVFNIEVLGIYGG